MRDDDIIGRNWTSRDLAEALANMAGKPFHGKDNEKNRMIYQGEADDLLAEISMIVMMKPSSMLPSAPSKAQKDISDE